MVWILIGLIALALLFGWWQRQGTGQIRSRSLKEEYRRKLGLPPDVADSIIDEQVEKLRQRHPNRSTEWYLEKMIYDLERDQK